MGRYDSLRSLPSHSEQRLDGGGETETFVSTRVVCVNGCSVGDEAELNGNLFVSLRSSAALGRVCLEKPWSKLWVKVGGFPPRWNVTLDPIEPLCYTDTSNTAQ